MLVNKLLHEVAIFLIKQNQMATYLRWFSLIGSHQAEHWVASCMSC